MGKCWEEKRAIPDKEVPFLSEGDNNDKKGGFRTLPFIIANEAFEKMATYGLSTNMTFYLMNEYHMEMATASSLLYIWSSATNFAPLPASILADSYLGQFHTIGFGSVICLMGMILLWSTTTIPLLRPPPCDQHVTESICRAPTIFQFVFLCFSLGLISIGAGAIRSCSLAFGANQLEKSSESDKTFSGKESYFGWYYAAYMFSVLIALTCVVYVQDNLGWGMGFAVPAVLMFFAVVSFFLASSFYIRRERKTSLISGLIQVIVASHNNRNLKLSDAADIVYYSRNGSGLVFPSEKLRFLNKACIVKDPQRDLDSDGKAKDPWHLCTVEQVEELKSLLKVIPIWSTGTIMAVNMSQNSFPLLQAASMDRRITKGFTIPAASFSTVMVVSVILWVVLYDRVFLPLVSRAKGRPFRLGTKTRMGIGIFLSFLAMIATALVESIRRVLAINEGFLDHPDANVRMSALWLVPQNCLSGFAEASNAIAQNEFYFSELPRSMSSIASSLNGIGMSLANLVASSILNAVDSLSRAGGGESWISSDINKGRYDYYYLVLAGLSVANMIYFLFCCKAYGPLKEETQLEEEEI